MASNDPQHRSLSSMLERLDLASSVRSSPSAVFRHIGLMILLGAIIAHFGMRLNNELLANSIANTRFAELQIVSGQLTDDLKLLRTRLQLIGRFSLVPEHLKRDAIRPDELRIFLEQFQESAPQIQRVSLIDEHGHSILAVGTAPPSPISPAQLTDTLAELPSGGVFHSALEVSQQRLQHWMVTRLADNQHGAVALLMELNQDTNLPTAEQLGREQAYEYLAVDHRGQVLGGQSLGLVNGQPLADQFPDAWRDIQQQTFGEITLAQSKLLFLRLALDQEKPFFLLSHYKTGREHPWQKRYNRQIATAAVIIMMVLASLIWRHHRQRDESGGRQRAELLAEALFQGREAVLLFALDGRCLAANAAANNQLSHCRHLLHKRRFRHLFHCDTLAIDMVWQVVRSSQQWSGTLMDREQGNCFEATLRRLLLNEEELILVTLEDRAQIQVLEHQLKTLDNLTQSASGLALVDQDLKVMVHNSALARLLRQGEKDLVGKSLPELVDWQERVLPEHPWQGVIWYQRGNGSRRRGLVSLSAEDPLGDEAQYRVFTLAPYLEAQHIDGLRLSPTKSDMDLARALDSLNAPASLLMISLAQTNMLANGEEMLFRQHQLVRRLEPLLPGEAQIGTLKENGEICLLLPGWSDRAATKLGLEIQAHCAAMLEDNAFNIGLVMTLPDQEWDELLESARDAVTRARLAGLIFCQARTRTLA